MPLSIELLGVERLGPFTFRWPEGEETFTHGWAGVIRTEGGESRFRHGLGARTVYGRSRAHSVTWLDGQPIAEGVAADDFETSGALISRLKLVDGRLARRIEEVPDTYDRSTIVHHRDEIDAPYSPRGLAVKLGQEDLLGWVRFAFLRRQTKRSSRSLARPSRPAVGRVAVVPDRVRPAPRFPPIERATKDAVAQALVAFEESENGPFKRGLVALTDEVDAEQLVREDAFAFLLAVIFDQGVDYRTAWRAPFVLRERLGHLDPVRMIAEPAAVAEAIARRPALQRFVNNVATWTVAAARRVVEEYEGNTSRIWTNASASVIRDRLDAFPGISQKKAAMAVMLLWRNRGVEIRDMQDCDVAVDIHLRRVFLRTGLAERDDPTEMIQSARDVYPQLPAALDPPAWTVGRRWCRPTVPDCPNCPLTDACPKLIDRAAGVNGP